MVTRMDNDDRQVGRVLRRREVLALLGAAGGAAVLVGGSRAVFTQAAAAAPLPAGSNTTLAQTSAATCVVKPELTEGPYFVDEGLNRPDIRVEPSDGSMKEGSPLELTFNVSQFASGACGAPLAGAQVDVWHCDALGVYSGEPSEGSEGETYLRGIQLTDGNGQVKFATIYPGQYPGRTTHIHVKVHIGGQRGNGAYSGGHVSHTGQLFTNDRDDAEVFAVAPYNRNHVELTPRNADFIFRDQHGSSSELALAPAGNSLVRDGFTAKVTLGVERG